MAPIDLAALAFGFLAALAVALPGAPEGARGKVLAAAGACAVVMRLVGPLAGVLAAVCAAPLARRLAREPEGQERIVDGAKYAAVLAAAVGLAFVARGLLLRG